MRWHAIAAGPLLAGALFSGCGDDDDPESTPTAAATQAMATPAAASPTTPATTMPSPTSAPSTTAPRGLTGIFEEPRTGQQWQQVTPPAPPASPFLPWDRETARAVIYDIAAGKEVDLGPGSAPVFSPNSKLAAWGAGNIDSAPTAGEVRVMELASGQIRVLGPGRFPRFLDNDTLAYFRDGGNQLVAHNLATGAKTDITGQELERRYSERLTAERETTPDGFRVTAEARGPGLSDVKVTNTANGQVVLAFQASAVRPAGAGHIVVASKPLGETVNLFLVAIATGQAEYVATTRFTDGNFPLVADGARIAWVDDFCGQPAGNLFVFQRASKTLTELVGISSFVRLTPDGLLALGAFGARRLMHPANFETVATIPDGSDVGWSPDYRYASHGWVGGHGGLC